MNRYLLRSALGATAALTLLLTGCGVAASGSGAPASSSSSGSVNNSIGAEFSGGKAGAASSSSSPVTIGMINQQGGQVSDPEASVAVQATFDYINKEQGGVGGHPLKLALCTVTSSEEEAQQCALRFVNQSSVSAILQGGLNVGTDAVHTTINGAKPTVIALANPGTDATAANAFAVNPGALAALPGFATYAVAQGYKNVGLVVSSNPGDLAIAQLAKNIFSAKGVTSKLTTFPAGSTDLTSAYTAALQGKPEAITPVVATTAGCTASAKALQAIGTTTPVMGTGLCATDQIKSALGDFPKWAYESTTLSLYAPDSTGQLAFYKAVMAKYAGPDAQLGIDAPAAFGAAFVLAKVLNGIGADKITPASVAAGLKAYTSGILLGAPRVAFGSVHGMPTLSGLADRFYAYQGNGQWRATSWQSLPE